MPDPDVRPDHPADLVLRPVRPADLSALTAIYNHYIRSGAVTFDTRVFRETEREPWLAQFSDDGPHRLFVAEVAGRVRGYAGSTAFRSRPAYATTVETTVYLAPDAVGQGLGAALYHTLFEALAGEDLHRALAGITLPNEGSVRLHERFGFERAGVFREVGRKLGRYWDVAWYERPL